jgi:signal transduction histidine kinase
MDQFALTLDGFIPHGVCLLWQAGLVYLHVAANALIALAYFSIPFAIFYFVRRRPDIHFKSLHWQFAAFILLCGLTHVMGIVVLWLPLYWLQGAVMAATALISLFAAALLWKLMPSLLGIPSAGKLQEINSRLQQEIAEKNQLMETLRRETQRMESLSQEKSAFLSNVSHETAPP